MAYDPQRTRALTAEAVAHYWRTRAKQRASQRSRKRSDQGTRSAVTGGKQMEGFSALLDSLTRAAGISNVSIFREKALELPGFFRATKKWDFLIVHKGNLLAVIEAKSQTGPSFGNNFNNRAEEAIGSATDLWTAFREGAFGISPQPWMGYVFLVEDAPASRRPVEVDEPHFAVFEDFKGASYQRRYELLCRRLVRERLYCKAAFLTSPASEGTEGTYSEPAEDLTMDQFARSFFAHLGAHA
ncbi:PaeR7I family type II restriction endonuclease [Candidatus Poribacteria bacterium]|nr:PaeR7I family type II restriction endonuclease [Candidatus Poribacteria bacterium]